MLGLCLMVGEGFSQTISKMTLQSSYIRPGTQEASSGIWGWTSNTGKEYALLTSRKPGGVSVVDISDPKTPKLIQFYPSGHNSVWFELNSSGNYVYMVSQEGTMGLFTLDMSPLNSATPGNPVALANNNSLFTNAHTIWIDNTVTPAVMWVTPGMQSIAVFSLADPKKPAQLAKFDPSGSSHDIFVRGNKCYHSTAGSTTNIWDVTNPAAKKDIATISGLAVAHNAWPTDDDKYLFTTEESVGRKVRSFDISNPATPSEKNTWIGVTGVIAHNVYVQGKILWVAHYSGGLWAVDISDPTNMKTLGYHRPSTSTATYGGTWGCYPYFKSGNIIHGDDEKGLMVVKPDFGSVGIDYGTGAAKFTISPLNSQEIEFQLPAAGEYALSIFTPAGKQIFSRNATGTSGMQKLSVKAGGLANGNYVVKLNQASHIFSSPIVIRN